MKFLSLFVIAAVCALSLAAPATEEKKSLTRMLKHSPVVQIIGQKATDCIPDMVTKNVKNMATNGLKCVGDIATGAIQGLAISGQKYINKFLG